MHSLVFPVSLLATLAIPSISSTVHLKRLLITLRRSPNVLSFQRNEAISARVIHCAICSFVAEGIVRMWCPEAGA